MRPPDRQAGPPRKPVSEQREAPLASELRAPLDPDEVQALIRQATDYRARKRNLAPGRELEDWLEAEAEVMMRLGLWE
jgi:hypothetical protein